MCGYAVGVVAFSVVFSIPHFMEYAAGEAEDGTQVVAWTDLRANETYSLVYSLILEFLFRIILPAAVMIYTNMRFVFSYLCFEGQVSFYIFSVENVSNGNKESYFLDFSSSFRV